MGGVIMKRLSCFVLALGLLFSACASPDAWNTEQVQSQSSESVHSDVSESLQENFSSQQGFSDSKENLVITGKVVEIDGLNLKLEENGVQYSILLPEEKGRYSQGTWAGWFLQKIRRQR